MAYSDDHIALAAEYALGTLDADERAQVESMMAVDADFTAMVVAWQHKLGALNQMVGSVEPRPEVWDTIRAAVGHSTQQAPIVLPQPVTPAAPAVEAPVVVAPETSGAMNSNVIDFAAKARRWRNVATIMSAIAAALAMLVGVSVSRPDLMPGAPGQKAPVQVAQTKAPPATPRASAQYVALLQKDAGGPAFILTVDEANKNFTVRKVGASAEAGSSYELWLISDKLPKPRSLGVIGTTDFTSRPVLASYDAEMVKQATYAVTIEQPGGSPDGNPHSAPVFTGKLIETVPPPR